LEAWGLEKSLFVMIGLWTWVSFNLATTPELPFPDKPVPASLPSNASIGGCKQGSIQGQVLRGNFLFFS